MSGIRVRPLSEDHGFGARIAGITSGNVNDPGLRHDVFNIFEERGVIVFEEIENSVAMQKSLSEIFGPLQDHAFKGVTLVDGDTLPGVVDFDASPADPDVMEVEGKLLASWVPWHFDACYSDRLNRAGLLRPLHIPESGGETGFTDGIQLYESISPDLRERFMDLEILYHAPLMFEAMRFGKPDGFRILRLKAGKREMFEQNRNALRSIHPAIWRRPTGEHVLHVCPWQAAGILGMENEEGDALLEALFAEMDARMKPYFHRWQPNDMVVWDNWRCLHSAKGHDPSLARHMHRSTIHGDYGLGRYELGDAQAPVGMME